MYFGKNLSFFIAVLAAFSSVEIGASHSPDCDWEKLEKANKEFVHNPHYARERAKLVAGQNPRYVILSCSDSRVPPEIIFEQGLGDLFVARVAGNVANKVVIDSIEYAISHFDVTTLIVMGHSHCGAVEGALARLQKNQGAFDRPEGDHLNAVLIPIERAIVEAKIDIYAPNALELSIKANVDYVAKQLLKRSSVIEKAVKSGQMILVGAEYKLKSGHVEQLFTVKKDGIDRN